jgi:hypothetical protein
MALKFAGEYKYQYYADTLSELPSIGQEGAFAYVVDTQKTYVNHNSSWEEYLLPTSGSGGGGGGAVTIANGADVTQGAKADAPITSPTDTASIVSILKGIYAQTVNNREAVVDAGTATGGTNSTLIDTNKEWQTDVWKDALVEVTQGSKGYIVKVLSNTSTTLTFSTSISVTVVAGNSYQLKLPVQTSNVTIADGADVTLGAKADTKVTDPSLSASVIGLLKGVLESSNSINTNTDGVETLLTSIKNTDGIKKITDALPAGDNNIGNVDIVSSVLPTGASTGAKQDTGNTSLSNIDTKTPTLGQKTKANSQPVVLASDSDPLPSGTNVIGRFGIDQTTDGATNKVQARNATHDNFNSNANVQVGDTDVSNANPIPVDIRSIQAGDNNIGNVDVVSSALPTGASTSALQATANTNLSNIDTKTPTLGQKTKANSVPVVLSSDSDNVTVDVNSSALPTGASTSALQTTGNTSLSNIDGKLPSTLSNGNLKVAVLESVDLVVTSRIGDSTGVFNLPDGVIPNWGDNTVVGTNPATFIEFNNVSSVNGGEVVIMGISLSAINLYAPDNSEFRLVILDDNTVPSVNNTAFSYISNATTLLGYVDFKVMNQTGFIWGFADNLNIKRKLKNGSNKLYGQLITKKGGYSAMGGAEVIVKLHCVGV